MDPRSPRSPSSDVDPNLLRPEHWTAPVDGPLEIHGVVARDAARDALLSRLLADDDERLAQLRGVASETIAIVTGPTELLPWVDGAIYLRRQPSEPRLLLPTTAQCSVPATTLLPALLRIAGGPRPPIVALPDTRMVISLADALPPDRGVLHRLLRGGAT